MSRISPSCFLRAGLASVVTALLGLVGCARPELLFPEPPPIDPLAEPVYGLAQICVLRPHTWAMAHTVLVEDNGHLVGATRGPSYFCYAAQPGTHRLELVESKPRPAIELKVAAGQRIYVHHRISIGFNRLKLLSEEQIEALLDKCEYSQLVATPILPVYSESSALPAQSPVPPPSPPSPPSPPVLPSPPLLL